MPIRCAWMWGCLLGGTLAAQAPATIDFARDVRPVLQQRCISCHGPSQQMRGLRLDRRRDAMPNKVGANGASIVAGDSAASPLYRKLIGRQPGLQMPPDGPLSAEQITIIKTWIDQGADWPDEFSGETPLSNPDPQATRMIEALRNGDRQAFRAILRSSSDAVNRKGPRGDTPLMSAALYGGADSVRLLLEARADPNLRNQANASALMYAVDDLEKSRLLLDHGADANARSDEGRTPLLIAAGRAGSSPVVNLLLDRGADATVQVSSGTGLLARAGASGDEATIRLLLSHGAARRPVPLPAALRAGCSPCFETLMGVADRSDLNAALATATRRDDARTIRTILDRGADDGANIVPLIAYSPTVAALDTVKALIARGANVNGKARGGETVLEIAKRQGNIALVDLLTQAGAREEPAAVRPVPKPTPAPSPREALARAIPLLQRADVSFIKKSGCVSCHNNSLTAMAIASARQKGIPVDSQTERAQTRAIVSYLDANRERALQGVGIPGGLDTVGYILLGLAAEKYPADETTDVWARYLKDLQLGDGHWPIQAARPPLESSDIQATATAMRALQVYGLKTQRAEYDQSVRSALRWLERAQPRTTEDSVFQILGLCWAGGNREVIRKASLALLASQQRDGGWSQLPWLASDAYATGQALVALNESRNVAVNARAYQRGVEFLLNSQLADGSWFVRTRAFPAQPYFDSDFPHGEDQFISTAGTNWAVMALAR